jgi:hypothetical protein
MIGVTLAGQWHWLAPGEEVPNNAEPEQFDESEPFEYLFVRRPDLDDSYLMRSLLNGKKPEDFGFGEVVKNGMGHFGYALGLRLCRVIG